MCAQQKSCWAHLTSSAHHRYLLTLCLIEQDPNVEDPLNKEAAKVLAQDRSKFEQLVRRNIASGVTIDGTYFPACRLEKQR
jgi:hypothetical protein